MSTSSKEKYTKTTAKPSSSTASSSSAAPRTLETAPKAFHPVLTPHESRNMKDVRELIETANTLPNKALDKALAGLSTYEVDKLQAGITQEVLELSKFTANADAEEQAEVEKVLRMSEAEYEAEHGHVKVVGDVGSSSTTPHASKVTDVE